MRHIDRYFFLYGSFLVIILITIMNLISDVATIEVINGKQYVVAINGEDLEFPRTPTPVDLDLHWVYRETTNPQESK